MSDNVPVTNMIFLIIGNTYYDKISVESPDSSISDGLDLDLILSRMTNEARIY